MDDFILDLDKGFKEGMLLFLKEFWPFILAFLGLYILAIVIKIALNNDELKRKKQRE